MSQEGCPPHRGASSKTGGAENFHGDWGLGTVTAAWQGLRAEGCGRGCAHGVPAPRRGARAPSSHMQSVPEGSSRAEQGLWAWAPSWPPLPPPPSPWGGCVRSGLPSLCPSQAAGSLEHGPLGFPCCRACAPRCVGWSSRAGDLGAHCFPHEPLLSSHEEHTSCIPPCPCWLRVGLG